MNRSLVSSPGLAKLRDTSPQQRVGKRLVFLLSSRMNLPVKAAIVGLQLPNVQQCLLPRHSQCSSPRRMIHAVLSTMLVASAALMPGAEAAGVRHLLQGFSSENFETATNNDGSQSSSSGGTSPTSSKTHSTQSSEVACSSKAKSFTIADSKDVHVRAGTPCTKFGGSGVAVIIKQDVHMCQHDHSSYIDAKVLVLLTRV
jgi:hypothetical protein